MTKAQKEKINVITEKRIAELDDARFSREERNARMEGFSDEAESVGGLSQQSEKSIREELGSGTQADRIGVEDILSGMRIKDTTQLESDMLSDLTRFDEILMGGLYKEASPEIELNAIDGAQDAISFIATLIKRMNKDRYGSGKDLFKFDAKQIEAPVRKGFSSSVKKEVIKPVTDSPVKEEDKKTGTSVDIKQYKDLLKSMYKSE